MKNIFEYPSSGKSELIEKLVSSDNVTVEKIVSYSNITPEDFWYDDSRDEWVIVLRGKGKLEFEDGKKLEMNEGDFYLIKSHEKHRVIETDNPTLWLCIYFQ
ncbi:MAG: cupin domain-containing protein [Deltaproteobacteria bacterium]|nr:cupin domain-containing protein [Deltaproteobacteria bacterium]